MMTLDDLTTNGIRCKEDIVDLLLSCQVGDISCRKLAEELLKNTRILEQKTNDHHIIVKKNNNLKTTIFLHFACNRSILSKILCDELSAAVLHFSLYDKEKVFIENENDVFEFLCKFYFIEDYGKLLISNGRYWSITFKKEPSDDMINNFVAKLKLLGII